MEIRVKSVLNKKNRTDPIFHDAYTLNPYSGCTFNCLFCYIRGSKYGEHRSMKVSIKANFLEVLERQLALRARQKAYGYIVLASATDPYLHFEEEQELTKGALELMARFRFPVHLITRSDLVRRDFDQIRRVGERAILPNVYREWPNSGALLSFSFSTLSDETARIFEPGATAPSLRLQCLQEAVATGIRTGVSLMPLLPWISDTSASLEVLFQSFQESGVDYVLPASLGLHGDRPADSRSLVLQAVAKHFPDLLEKYEGWFVRSHGMPKYYKAALQRKMAEMCTEYELNGEIFPGLRL